VIVLQFSAAAHTLTVNCNEMDGDRIGQPGNRSYELCSNYL